jgi:hypothetical protein
MEIGNIVNYFGKEAEVLLFDKTYVVIKFKDRSKLCTTIIVFDRK